MVLRKSIAAVAVSVKSLVRDLLDINWNDHLLSEIGSVHARRYDFHDANKEF